MVIVDHGDDHELFDVRERRPSVRGRRGFGRACRDVARPLAAVVEHGSGAFGQFGEGLLGRGNGQALALADAADVQARAGEEVFGFGLCLSADRS